MNILHIDKQRFRFRHTHSHTQQTWKQSSASLTLSLLQNKNRTPASPPPNLLHTMVSPERSTGALCTQTVSNSGHMVHDERTTETRRDDGTVEQSIGTPGIAEG